MSDLTFPQELFKIAFQSILPMILALGGGRLLLDRYDGRKKTREQQLELVRFIRQRQYEALQDLYRLFGDFMCLYRRINSAETDLRIDSVRQEILESCYETEAAVDATILRIASEFTHTDRATLEEFLANLRQSAQLWRECVRNRRTLPFTYSEQPDYLRFKAAFANTTTYIASAIYERLEPAKIICAESRQLLTDIFSNKWERSSAQDGRGTTDHR